MASIQIGGPTGGQHSNNPLSPSYHPSTPIPVTLGPLHSQSPSQLQTSPSSSYFDSFDCGIYLILGRIFPINSVAKHLPGLLKIIAFHPIFTLVGVLIIYPILTLIIFPFYLLSFLVTKYGSCLIFSFIIIYLVRYFAICMIFPGSLPSLVRNVTKEYLKGMANQFDKIGVSASSIATSLIHTSTTMNSNITIRADDLQILSTRSLPIFIAVIHEGIRVLTNEIISHEEMTQAVIDLTTLKTSLESLQSELSSLSSKLSPFVSSHTQIVSLRSFVSSSSAAELVNFGMRCGENAHNLRVTSQSLKTSSNKQESSSYSNFSQFKKTYDDLTDFWRGPCGLEKSALPMIRKHITLQYLAPLPLSTQANYPLDHDLISAQLPSFHTRVCRFNLIGIDNNVIDGLFIGHSHLSLQTIHSIYRKFNKEISTPLPPMQTPTVLFCPPNAGFYECLVMAQPNSSWLGFYLSKGMNFVVFNYRGYGASSGSPDPTKLQLDGLTVSKYLKDELGVINLVVHGESVGGLVACHIARHQDLKGLIIDRSFTCLDAVSRRMLGDWAGTGLQLLGQWKTDSLENYLRSSCPHKIILQDPDDEIINHSASLKVGIAANILFSDHSFGSIPTLHREYNISNYLDSPLVCPEKYRDDVIGLIHFYFPIDPMDPETSFTHFHRYLLSTSPPSPSLHSQETYPLSESFVEYFAACVLNIAKQAAVAATFRKKRQNSSYSSINMRTRGVLNSYLSQDGNNDNDNDADTDTGGGKEKDLELNPLEGDVESSTGYQSPPSHRITNQFYQPRSNKWRQMEEFCSRNIYEAQHTLVEKIWLIIGRLDGESGQLLGQAVAEKYDGVRAWVMTYLLWGGLSSCHQKTNSNTNSHQQHQQHQHYNNPSLLNLPIDGTLPPSRSDMSRTIAELRYLLIHEHDLLSTPSSNLTSIPLSHQFNSILDFSDHHSNHFSHFYFLLIALEIFQRKRNEISQYNYNHLDLKYLPHGSTSSSPSQRLPIGRLVTVHCGHNGWPQGDEITQFQEYFNEIEFTKP